MSQQPGTLVRVLISVCRQLHLPRERGSAWQFLHHDLINLRCPSSTKQAHSSITVAIDEFKATVGEELPLCRATILLDNSKFQLFYLKVGQHLLFHHPSSY